MSALSAGLAFSALWLAACGDDGGTTVHATDTGQGDLAPDSSAETSPDSAEDTAPADVTADVGPLARISFQFLEWLDGPPVGGVSVHWTAPGGETQEATSDDDGRVSLSGIDWSKGPAMIVGAKAGYAVRGAVGARADFEGADVVVTTDGDVFVPMPAVGNGGWVHVTGNAVTRGRRRSLRAGRVTTARRPVGGVRDRRCRDRPGHVCAIRPFGPTRDRAVERLSSPTAHHLPQPGRRVPVAHGHILI